MHVNNHDSPELIGVTQYVWWYGIFIMKQSLDLPVHVQYP